MTRALLLALAATLAFAQTAKKPTAPPVKAEPARTTPAEAPKTTIKPSTGGLVGNKDSKVVHTAGCKTLARMKPASKVLFASKAEAEKAGYKACKVCKPS